MCERSVNDAFDRYIGIDYSGAETAEARIKGLQVYATTEGPPERMLPMGRHGSWGSPDAVRRPYPGGPHAQNHQIV